MLKNKIIKVTAIYDGQRLDVFLSEKLKLSRSQVQKMIAEGKITIDGNQPRTAGLKVRAGNKITVSQSSIFNLQSSKTRYKLNPKSKKIAFQPEADTALRSTTLTMTPRVVAATPDYVVVEKPSGLLVHPTQAGEKDALVAWLVKKYPKIKKIGDDPKIRPGIVHRLDKEASGLMVIAKTQAMFDHLKNQFKNRTIKKEYLALAHGKFARDWDEINLPIARSENEDRMAARPVGDLGAKEARTEFIVEKQYAASALLRVFLYTGRMHQIRVHLLAYNHPLVGDTLYYHKKNNSSFDKNLRRLFLHSAKLSFTDLSGETKTFESPLPEELENFLSTLK